MLPMKKTLSLLSLICFLGFSCTKTSVSDNENVTEDNVASVGPITLRTCASQEVLIRQLTEDPSLAKRMNDIEKVISNFERNPSAYRLSPSGIIEVPVVVNVLYKTAVKDIPLSQIQSQIDVLNADYSGKNSDTSLIPANFLGVKAGDVGVRFVLHQVIRKSTNKTSWGANDAMKKSSSGGINPTNPTTKLTCGLAI